MCNFCQANARATDSYCRECGNRLNDGKQDFLPLAIDSASERRMLGMVRSPESNISLGLGTAALLTAFFPILSLPCSITGAVLGGRARNKELTLHGEVSSRTKLAFWLNIGCIILTAVIMLLAIPGAVERNLGHS